VDLNNLPEPVVILGGGGFIGSNLGETLFNHAVRDLRLVDVQFQDWRWSPEHYRYTIDLREPKAADYIIEKAGTVFHLAADMGGVEYFHGPYDYAASLDNQLMTTNVLKACIKHNTPRLIYSGSVCAYDTTSMNSGIMQEESGYMKGDPDAMYGADKRNGTHFVVNAPIDGRAVLFDTVYGPGQEHEGVRMKFPAAVATKALKSLNTGQLILFGDGSQKRCYLYIDDAITRLLNVATRDRPDGPVNIGGTNLVSCREIAEFCLDYVESDAILLADISMPTGVKTRKTSQAKYTNLYGGWQETAYQEGFALFIDWLKTVLV